MDDRATDVVRWTSRDLEVRIFLDAQTHLISKLAYRAAAPGAPAPVDVEVVTTDFREVAGMKFPFRVVGYQNGQKNFEMTATNVKVNSGIAPSGFSKPAK